MKTLARVLVLVLALPALSAALGAQSMVRVEVIVFHHIDGSPDRWPTPRAQDFSDAPDPHDLARLASWTARLAPDAPDAAVDNNDRADPPGPFSGAHLAALRESERPLVERTARVHGGAAQTPTWPDAYVGRSGLSPTMQRALNRLDSSDLHTVLTSVAWLQPLDRQARASAVRIRGHQAASIDWTSTRSAGFVAEGPIRLPPSTPLVHYRLDGTLQLRQRQFRHADMDLLWTEPVAKSTGGNAGEPADDSRFLVHRLSQSRPIRLGRLEYFDSAWLGALILVEEWQRPEAPASRSGQEPD